MDLICSKDSRRDAVRRSPGRNGLDYVEVDSDGRTLHVYFLGKLPPELREDSADLTRHFEVSGGVRVTGLRVIDVDPRVDPDPERDDRADVRLDRDGDLSTYRLTLVGVEGIDPPYASAEFSFKVDCPSTLDCAPAQECAQVPPPEPRIDYLAKDYASFRRLLLDRLSMLMPSWRERHAPDLAITLVELFAYVGDQLSYDQDSVATEAYLDTARQRISVRRHARLVDYSLHEGCNARAWVAVSVSQDLELPASEVSFVTGLNEALPLRQSVLTGAQAASLPSGSYEVFEPFDREATLRWRKAHGRIRFHTWGRGECCLPKGATRATLLDSYGDDGARELHLEKGDVLILEEVIGPRTGLEPDADPARRHAVRLTRVRVAEDPVIASGGGDDARPTPIVDVEWSEADALPFALCITTLGPAPECVRLDDVSVARGNVVLVDHGRAVPPQELCEVPEAPAEACCLCEGEPSDVEVRAGAWRPTLRKAPLTHRVPWPASFVPASRSLVQDPRAAVPQASLVDDDELAWTPRPDLFASGPEDAHFVIETDDKGRAHLRFGDGELGRALRAGQVFTASYRIGCGRAGNVGAEAIARLVLASTTLSGIEVRARNPLPAVGGVDPESVAEAKLLAPRAFRSRLERAVTAEDYAELAQRHPQVQRASSELVWTGSWYEADVAVDPRGRASASDSLLERVEASLERYRRMGHDLHVERAVSVPVDLALEVCALPGHDRSHVQAELLKAFSSGVRADGSLGYFHPDRLTFGKPLRLSHIIAVAQAVTGVECVRVVRLQRLFEEPNGEIEAGLLELGTHEIARLDGDPARPENGRLEIVVLGGR